MHGNNELRYSLPIGAVAMIILFFFLRLPTPQGKLIDKLKRVDYAGKSSYLYILTLFIYVLSFLCYQELLLFWLLPHSSY